MPLGNDLLGNQQLPIHPALAQSMAPQAVAAQAQPGGGLGALMQSIQNNPAAIQMLLATGAKLLNPTSFQAPGGRIAEAVSSGVAGYGAAKTAAEDREFKKQMLERTADREDRKVDLTEQEMATEADQWTETFGLESEKLDEQKKLWAAQAEQYSANADALRQKAAGGGAADLTGPERIINNLASVFENADIPPDRAYTMAFDIYNKADESKAKAIAGVYESLGMLGSTPKGEKLIESIIEQIDATFSSGTTQLDQARANQQEVAPGVTQSDVQAALTAINQNDGTNLRWEDLNDMQRDRLIKAIKQRKGGGQ